MDIKLIMTIISTFGLGGIIGAYIKHLLSKKKDLYIRLNQINEEKYRTILIYMSFMLNPQNRSHFIMQDPYLDKIDNKKVHNYSKEKLTEYYYQSLLYASNRVLQKFKDFLQNPTRDNYYNTAIAMRSDLWNKKIKIDPSLYKL